MTIEETLQEFLKRLDEKLALAEIGIQNLHEGLQDIHNELNDLDNEICNCKAVINVHNC